MTIENPNTPQKKLYSVEVVADAVIYGHIKVFAENADAAKEQVEDGLGGELAEQVIWNYDEVHLETLPLLTVMSIEVVPNANE